MTTPRKAKTLRTALFAAAASVGVLGAANAPLVAHDHGGDMAKQAPNIVETAQSTGVHNTLVTAVVAADLAATLASPGPFTVFAPTDAAFAKLPEGTVETLIQPENKGALTGILTYHAVAGRVTASDLLALIESNGGEATINTVSGGQLTARVAGDSIEITDGAGRKTMVTTADVDTSNGIIHVTDGVFLPA